MTALEVLKVLTSQLSLASTGEDIGRALFAVAKRFGFTTALIVDMTHFFNRIGPAIIFSAMGRAPLELFDTQRPFANHPFMLRAQGSDKPFVMSRVKEELGTADEAWWAGLPAHLKETDGIIVPVHVDGDFVWYSGLQLSPIFRSARYPPGVLRFTLARLLHEPSTTRRCEACSLQRVGVSVGGDGTDIEVGKILSISPRTAVSYHNEDRWRRRGFRPWRSGSAVGVRA
jgi:hypothetical protein